MPDLKNTPLLAALNLDNDDDAQFMDQFETLSPAYQRVIIGAVFLLILVAIVILRDMIKTEEKTLQ